MFKQAGAVILCFAGILLSLWFWLQFDFLQSWLVNRSISPKDFLSGFAAWITLGAISCFFLSRHIACWGMKVDILPLDPSDEVLDGAHLLYKDLIQKMGLSRSPEFGVFEKPEVNAFAVGWSLKHSVVAVSRGALEQLSSDELELLLRQQLLFLCSGHARALSLMQGMIYSISLYVARMLALLLGTSLRATEEEETSSQSIELLLMASLMFLLATPSVLVFWAFNRSFMRDIDRQLLSQKEGSHYPQLLQRVESLKEPGLEIFSDSFKWRVKPYPKVLGFASPVPSLKNRIKSLAV